MPSLFSAYSSKLRMAVLIVRGGGRTVKPMFIALLRFESRTMISCRLPSTAAFYGDTKYYEWWRQFGLKGMLHLKVSFVIFFPSFPEQGSPKEYSILWGTNKATYFLNHWIINVVTCSSSIVCFNPEVQMT